MPDQMMPQVDDMIVCASETDLVSSGWTYIGGGRAYRRITSAAEDHGLFIYLGTASNGPLDQPVAIGRSPDGTRFLLRGASVGAISSLWLTAPRVASTPPRPPRG